MHEQSLRFYCSQSTTNNDQVRVNPQDLWSYLIKHNGREEQNSRHPEVVQSPNNCQKAQRIIFTKKTNKPFRSSFNTVYVFEDKAVLWVPQLQMCQGLETPLTARLVDLLWPLEPVGGDGFQHSRQTRKHKSRIPCPIFGESRFPGNSQIPDPLNIFIVFPIPAPYFGQIPNPKNTLPDPDVWQESQGVWTNPVYKTWVSISAC